MIRDIRPLEVAETKETLAALVEKLSAKDGRWWRNILDLCLQGINPLDIRNWREPWMVLNYGFLSDRRSLKKHCTEEPFVMDKYAAKVFANTTFAWGHMRKARLMAAPVEILGFRRQVVSIEEVCQKLADMGCEALTNEMVYNLHYQYVSRHDKNLYVFSEDILKKEGIKFRTHYIIGPDNGTSKKLEAFGVKPDAASNFNLKHDDVIVFVQP